VRGRPWRAAAQGEAGKGGWRDGDGESPGGGEEV